MHYSFVALQVALSGKLATYALLYAFAVSDLSLVRTLCDLVTLTFDLYAGNGKWAYELQAGKEYFHTNLKFFYDVLFWTYEIRTGQTA